MNILKLSWRNLISKPLNLGLSLILFGLGVGLISLLSLMNQQLQDKFDKNLAGIDLVVGAKGSPLQLILCSMYHIDAPTGNISLKEARPFLNPEHPLIEQAIPLSLGDSYGGYRIVGTNHDLVDLYEGEIKEGRIWKRSFEVTIGATVSNTLGLKLGDKFKSSHGLIDDPNLAHDDAPSFVVKGILKPSGSVLDQLILCSTSSIWEVHAGHDHDHEGEGHDDHDHEGEKHDDHDDHDHEGHDHDDHDHEGHDHDDHDHEGHDHDHDDHAHDVEPEDLLAADETMEITSILLKYRARNFQTLNMPRNINENTDMIAASPAYELNRIYSQLDAGTRALGYVGLIIVFVSGLSIFISLFSSLKERRYELALIRVMGASRATVFMLIILEGLLLAVLGYVLGIILSHVGMEVFAGFMEESYRYSFSGWTFLKVEWLILIGAILIGFLAAFIPAIEASRDDISDTLTQA